MKGFSYILQHAYNWMETGPATKKETKLKIELDDLINRGWSPVEFITSTNLADKTAKILCKVIDSKVSDIKNMTELPEEYRKAYIDALTWLKDDILS